MYLNRGEIVTVFARFIQFVYYPARRFVLIRVAHSGGLHHRRRRFQTSKLMLAVASSAAKLGLQAAEILLHQV